MNEIDRVIRPAGFWVRFAAAWADLVIIFVICLNLQNMVRGHLQEWLISILPFAFACGYNIYFINARGQTPGMIW